MERTESDAKIVSLTLVGDNGEFIYPIIYPALRDEIYSLHEKTGNNDFTLVCRIVPKIHNDVAELFIINGPVSQAISDIVDSPCNTVIHESINFSDSRLSDFKISCMLRELPIFNYSED